MCKAEKRGFSSYNIWLIGAFVLGIVTGFFPWEGFTHASNAISSLIIDLLKLISLPMIFLSVVSTIGGMQSFHEVRTLDKKVLLYAVGTTFIAAVVGLTLYQLIHPVQAVVNENVAEMTSNAGSYFSILLDVFPKNIVGVFYENHVIGVMILAVVLGLSILSLPTSQKKTLDHFFSSLFAALLKVTKWLTYLMPIGVWAFVTIFVGQMRNGTGDQIQSFLLYIACVIGANVIQGFIVLPLLVKLKGLSPIRLFKGTFPALTLGFFTRSSNAALPVTLETTQENLGISKKVSNFSIPLCSTINMNGCASFIIITVLYVATSYGMTFSWGSLVLWLGMATLAAVGNAGVPMGCYFLSGALLAAMDVPLTLLGLILPIYTLIDMVETALNIWSDVCITSIVDRDMAKKAAVETPSEETQAA